MSETLQKCPGVGCDHAMCIEQKRLMDGPTAAERADIIDLAFIAYQHEHGGADKWDVGDVCRAAIRLLRREGQ